MRTPQVDIRNVAVALLMRPLGLMEALSGGFSSLRKSPSAGQAGLSEHSEDRGGRDSHNPLVQHHIRQPDASHHGMLAFEGHDLFPLFRQDPVSFGHKALRTGFLARKASPAVIGPGRKIQDNKGFLDGNPARSFRCVTVFTTSSAVSGATWVPLRGPQCFFWLFWIICWSKMNDKERSID